MSALIKIILGVSRMMLFHIKVLAGIVYMDVHMPLKMFMSYNINFCHTTLVIKLFHSHYERFNAQTFDSKVSSLLVICSSILSSFKVDAASSAETIDEIVAFDEQLLDAAKNNDVRLARYLLQNGADANYEDNRIFSENRTVLLWASRNGHKEIVEMLLNVGGINVNAADKHGNTALMLAFSDGRQEVVQMLLNVKGINVNASNYFGDTVLMAASRDGHKEVVQMLLNVEGIEVNAATKFGETALKWPSHYGHKEIVTMIEMHKDNKNSCIVM